MGLVVCIDYSGGSRGPAYGVAVYDAARSGQLAGELSWLKHPSEIYGKVPKRKYLEASLDDSPSAWPGILYTA